MQPTSYSVEFDSPMEAIERLKACFESIEKTGFCSFRTFGYTACEAPDDWGWTYLSNIQIRYGRKIYIMNRPSYRCSDCSIDLLDICGDVLKTLTELNHIYTIDMLMPYYQSGTLTELKGIGQIRAEDIITAMDSWMMENGKA